MVLEYAGIAGLFLLLLAWIPETLDVIRSQKTELTLKFIAVYLLGSLLLAIHSWQLNDWVFLVLNALIIFANLINLYYYFYVRKS